jgi:hypothetical protein
VHQSLRGFVTGCGSIATEKEGMQELAANAGDCLSAGHRHSEPEHYARNAIYIALGGNLSFFARMIDLPHHESR